MVIRLLRAGFLTFKDVIQAQRCVEGGLEQFGCCCALMRDAYTQNWISAIGPNPISRTHGDRRSQSPAGMFQGAVAEKRW